MGRVFDDDRVADSVEGLIEFCNDWLTPDMVMAEIGCFRGVSTAIFAERVRRVYAIDPWLSRPDYFEIPRDMMATAEKQFDEMCKTHPNIVKYKFTSVIASMMFADGELDAVYIDGDHSEAAVRADLAAWIPKVVKGGLIAGHDYCMVGSLVPKVTVYPEQTWVYRK